MRKIFYGWWIVFACFFISFYVSGTTIFSFTAFFEPLSKEFGWSYTQISLGSSIRGLEYGLFAPVVGFLVDRLGAKRILFFGILITGIGFFLLSRVNSLFMFYGSFVVLSVGFSACVGMVMVSAAANWFKKDLGKALGIISAGFGAGGLFVPVTMYLINHYQWRTTFFIFGLGIWLFGIPLSLLVRKYPEQRSPLPEENISDTQHTPTVDTEREFSLGEALKTKAFWHISLADGIRLIAVTAIITHVIPYLSSLGYSRSQATFVATSIPVISIFGRLIFGWLGDILQKNHVMALVYILAGLSLLSFANVQFPWLLIPFLILFPLSWGGSPLRDAMIRESFGTTSLGSILGLMAGIATVARISGPILAGWTYDTFGGYHVIWLFLAGTFVFALILMLTIKPAQTRLI